MSNPLVPNGHRVPTITSSPIEALDANGDTWYIKPAGEQAEQIAFLGKIGLPTPETVILEGANPAQIAVKHAGDPLHQVIGEDTALAESIVRTSGALLHKVHTALEQADPEAFPELSLSTSPSTTANPIENFIYRFIDGKSSATNQIKNRLPEESEDLRILLLELVSSMREKGLPNELLDGQEMAYGDYKPENILYDTDKGLCLIDPQLNRGKRVADVAKFCTRTALEPNIPDIDVVRIFRGGYDLASHRYEFDAKEFIWLSSLDLANIISSYLGRVAQGNVDYRLTAQLASNDKYRKQVKALLAEGILTFETLGALSNSEGSDEKA